MRVYVGGVPLTERQLAAIPVLDWLLDLDNSRRTGRSQVVALCLVRRAARLPGQQVFYGDMPFDIARHQTRVICRNYVESWIASDHRLSPHVTYNRDFFRLDLPEPIPDWMPPEQATWPGEPEPQVRNPGFRSVDGEWRHTTVHDGGDDPPDVFVDGRRVTPPQLVDYASVESRLVDSMLRDGAINQHQHDELMRQAQTGGFSARQRPNNPRVGDYFINNVGDFEVYEEDGWRVVPPDRLVSTPRPPGANVVPADLLHRATATHLGVSMGTAVRSGRASGMRQQFDTLYGWQSDRTYRPPPQSHEPLTNSPRPPPVERASVWERLGNDDFG